MNLKTKTVGAITGFAVIATLFSTVPATANADELTLTPWASNSSATAYQKFDYKGIHELAIHGNEIYSGYGDWNDNIGPIDVVSTNLTTAAETKHGKNDGEEINVIREINNKLYMPNIDPKGGWDVNQGYVSNKSGAWNLHYETPFIHVFDVASTGDDLWLAGSIRNPDKNKYGQAEYIGAVKRSIDGGATWTIEKTASSTFGGSDSDRFYWLAAVDGKIYTSSNAAGSKQKIDYWENGQWKTIPYPREISFDGNRKISVETLGSKIIIANYDGTVTVDTQTNKIAKADSSVYNTDLYVDKATQTIYAISQPFDWSSGKKLRSSKDGLTWKNEKTLNYEAIPAYTEELPNGMLASYSIIINTVAVKDGYAYYGMSNGTIYKDSISITPTAPPITEAPKEPVTIEVPASAMTLAELKKPLVGVKAVTDTGENITNLLKAKTVSKWSGTQVDYTVTYQGKTYKESRKVNMSQGGSSDI